MSPIGRRNYEPIGQVQIGDRRWPFDVEEFQWLLSYLPSNDEWTKEVREKVDAIVKAKEKEE